MPKKFFSKTVAILVCLGIMSLSVPGLFAAEKKAPKYDFKLILEKPMILLSTFLPFLTPIFDNGKSNNPNNVSSDNGSNGKVRTLGGLLSERLSGGD